MSDKSRRKLIKSIAVGSSAVIAGKSLPESWSKPVVDSVILPAHAQTSQTPYQQTLSADPCNGATSGDAQTTSLNFDVSGFTPTSDGTLVATSSGDIGDPTETYTVSIEGTVLGTLGPSPAGDFGTATATFNLPLNVLQAAAADGTVTITFTPDAVVPPDNPIECEIPGGNTVGATLSF